MFLGMPSSAKASQLRKTMDTLCLSARDMMVTPTLIIFVLFVPTVTEQLTSLKDYHEKFHDSVVEFANSFVGQLLVVDHLADDDEQALGTFWFQLMKHVSAEEMSMTLVETGSTEVTKGDALIKTKTSTVVMAVNTIQDLNWKYLDFGVRYSKTLRFRIAVLDTFTGMTEEQVLNHARSIIEPKCVGANVKFITITSWYLVYKGIWINSIAYPDDKKVCSVQKITESFNKSDARASASIKDFKGHPITVATVGYEPFVKMPSDGSEATADNMQGSEFELLRNMSKMLNFTILVTQPSDGNWGADTGNGSWSGIIGMVQRREADLGASGLVAVPTSRLAIRYLQPMEDECLQVITRTPLNLSAAELFAIFLPFPGWLWATLAALTVTAATLAYLIEKNRKSRGADWTVQILWYFSAQLSLGAPENLFGPEVGHMMRSIWMCWLWFTFFINAAYSTYLVSYLTVPKYENIPTTFQGFVDSDFGLGRVRWGDAIDDMILKSQDQSYLALRKKLIWFNRSKGWEDWSNLDTIGQRFGIIEQYSDAWSAVMIAGPEAFLLSKAVWSCSPVAWASPWNGIFIDPLNTKLKPLARFGILYKLRSLAREGQFNRSTLDKYDYGSDYSSSLLQQDDDKVYLQDLISVFLVSGIGYGFSICAFIFEVIYKKGWAT